MGNSNKPFILTWPKWLMICVLLQQYWSSVNWRLGVLKCSSLTVEPEQEMRFWGPVNGLCVNLDWLIITTANYVL